MTRRDEERGRRVPSALDRKKLRRTAEAIVLSLLVTRLVFYGLASELGRVPRDQSYLRPIRLSVPGLRVRDLSLLPGIGPKLARALLRGMRPLPECR